MQHLSIRWNCLNGLVLAWSLVASLPDIGLAQVKSAAGGLGQQRIVGTEIIPMTLPALIGVEAAPILKFNVKTEGTLNPITLNEIEADFLNGAGVDSFRLYSTGSNSLFQANDAIGVSYTKSEDLIRIPVEKQLADGDNFFWVAVKLNAIADIDGSVGLNLKAVTFDSSATSTISGEPSNQRIGRALRKSGDDGVNTFRIPGLVTTNKGTLIAVYDILHDGSGDLPGNIDVGMSRSTDGGQNWQPMRTLMDMGSDPKWNHDGVGDPSILVDKNTGTIWVAATWSHGNRSWNGSGPGLQPEETGQFMLVKSDDDGLTWSNPINITTQIKKPEWCFLLAGPGKGITMSDGTIVFPAQYQDPPNTSNQKAHRLPHSTFIYSHNHGETWQIATGAFDDTTESQIVELENGRLMLNCRYNRDNTRVVMTTDDMGKTWTEHPTSRKALIEPRSCMASLINVWRERDDDFGRWLLFSNPDSTNGRNRITIKASVDSGNTWLDSKILLDEQTGRGYSCMTMIDHQTIGILYESSQSDLVFQRISAQELFVDLHENR